MKKCVCCKRPASWSWQPFGPDDKVTSFMLPGSHYRGFPVLAICDQCKAKVEKGDAVWFEISYRVTERRHYCVSSGILR